MSFGYRLLRALSYASHSGFPWPMGGSDGHSPALRRALRRSVIERWPPGTRLAGEVLMALLWPLESLRDALVFGFRIERAAVGGRRRLGVALRAWWAALRWNMPPIDYLTYRLFEPGRPGPGHWLHSADSYVHFSAIAAPEVRALAWDKLAFARFAESQGAPVVPVLAAYGRAGTDMPFARGAPPPVDLIVKQRRGRGGQGQSLWQWDGKRHIAMDDGVEGGFLDWLGKAAHSGDLIVQALAAPLARLGQVAPVAAPVISVITAEGPDRRREPAFAVVLLRLDEYGAELHRVRLIDLVSGAVLPPTPGQAVHAWSRDGDRIDLGGFVIPDWQGILAAIDRLHAALPGPAPVLKWDVLLTRDGPRILEVNTGTGAYVPQSITLTPLTATPVGAALEAWAR